MLFKALSTPTLVEISRLRGLAKRTQRDDGRNWMNGIRIHYLYSAIACIRSEPQLSTPLPHGLVEPTLHEQALGESTSGPQHHVAVVYRRLWFAPDTSDAALYQVYMFKRTLQPALFKQLTSSSPSSIGTQSAWPPSRRSSLSASACAPFPARRPNSKSIPSPASQRRLPPRLPTSRLGGQCEGEATRRLVGSWIKVLSRANSSKALRLVHVLSQTRLKREQKGFLMSGGEGNRLAVWRFNN